MSELEFGRRSRPARFGGRRRSVNGGLARAAKSPPPPRPASRAMKALRLAAALLIALAGLAGLAAPAQAQTETTLVSNIGQINAGTRSLGSHDLAQAFRTGTSTDGYTLTSVEIHVRHGSTGQRHPPGKGGQRGSSPTGTTFATLTGPASPQAGGFANRTYEFTAPSDTTLSPSTQYWVVIERATSGGAQVSLWRTNADNEDATPAAGWTIDNVGYEREDDSTGDFDEDGSSFALKIRIKGFAKGTGATVPTPAAPYLPTNVSAAANVPLSIDVSWTAPTTTPSRLAVDISRNGRDWSTQRCTHYVINCRVWLSASATSYTHTAHLGGGSTRHYRIFADHSGTATDGHSLAVSATTSSNPRAFAARAGGSAGETTINVSWTPLAKLGADAVTGYGIEVSTDEGETWQTLVANTGSTATSYAHGSLSRGALRHYRVRAIAGTRMSGFGRSAWARTTPNDPGKPVLTLTRLRNPGGIIVWRDREGGILLPVRYELSWPRPDDGGEGELRLTYQFAWDGFANRGKVYRNDQGHDAVELFAPTAAALSFRVRARNEVGENCSVTESCSGAGPWSDPPSTIENAGKAINRANARALLGRFSGVPGRHDGSTRFRFELRFDREPEDLSYRTVRDGLLTVNGGSVVQARRVKRNSNLRWEVTVEPAGMEDVSITLPVRECSDANAVCAKGEPLAEEVTATVPIKAFTGSFSGVPAEHAGSGRFTMEFHLSEAPRGLGWRVVRDHLFEVSGGMIARARRIGAVRNKGWELTVAPSGKGDVTLTSLATASCDDANAVCTSDGRMLEGGATATVKGPATFSVADASVDEAAGATLDFVVTLSRARTSQTTVDYATSDGTAVAGSDYTATSGTLTFAAGTTSKTVKVAVLDDAHDEGNETMTFTLSNSVGAVLGDDEATGTIKNTDAMPQAWIARFGRTVAEQVVDAVGARMDGPSSAPTRVTLGGQEMLLGDAPANAPGGGPSLAGRRGDLRQRGEDSPARETSMSELLLASSFHLASAGGGNGNGSGRWSLWGRGARSGFDGTEGALTLTGDVTTGLVGADYESGRVLVGVALALSSGDGTYEESGMRGEVESSLAGVYPYLRYAVSERLSVWGAAGLGGGDLTLKPSGAAQVETDLSMSLAATGARGALLTSGGFELALRSDLAFVRAESDATAGLAASEADTSRLRLALEGSAGEMRFAGGALTPTVELGLRYDGGDAETGAGLELGGGLRYASGRLAVEFNARGLLAHEENEYEEWGVSASVRYAPNEGGRGLSLRAASTWGAATGGVDRLWSQRAAADLARGAFEPGGAGVDAEVGYGFDFRRGLLTPYTGVALTEGGETWRAGARWKLGPAFDVELEASLREPANGEDTESGLLLKGSRRW